MEIWKEIKGYEGIYEVSNLGQVRSSFGKTTEVTRLNKKVVLTWKQRIIKPRINNANCVLINLFKNKIKRSFNVGRLVAYTFYNQDYNDLSKTVNHIDGNRLNNKLENLEIINLKDNIRHAFSIKTMKSKEVFIKDLNKNVLLIFKSRNLASRYFNKPTHFINHSIKSNNLKFDNFEIIKGGNDENLETKRVSYFFRD